MAPLSYLASLVPATGPCEEELVLISACLITTSENPATVDNVAKNAVFETYRNWREKYSRESIQVAVV